MVVSLVLGQPTLARAERPIGRGPPACPLAEFTPAALVGGEDGARLRCLGPEEPGYLAGRNAPDPTYAPAISVHARRGTEGGPWPALASALERALTYGDWVVVTTAV